MGTHGLGGFHRLLLGSVTEKVVRTATCPVLTVPPSAPATTPRPIVFKRILCPIDYSPSALKALEYALELGRQADGCVTVLSALEYMDPEEPCEHVDFDIRKYRQRVIEHARERLHGQLAGEPRTWCAIEEIVAINRAYKEILQRAAGAAGRKIGVTEGIDSLSLNPDSQLKTMLAIVDLEKRLAQGAPDTAGEGT